MRLDVDNLVERKRAAIERKRRAFEPTDTSQNVDADTSELRYGRGVEKR